MAAPSGASSSSSPSGAASSSTRASSAPTTSCTASSRLVLPEPEMPVTTVRAPRGRSRSTPRTVCRDRPVRDSRPDPGRGPPAARTSSTCTGRSR
ncbi:hypothetical protein ACFPT5_22275 [Ornithinimicrobium kibberense]